MIELRKITLENRRALFNLEVSEEQRRFVASNLSSVASSYVLATNGGHPYPLAIYADEQLVGFVMLTYGITGYELPSIADDSYCIVSQLKTSPELPFNSSAAYLNLARLRHKHFITN